MKTGEDRIAPPVFFCQKVTKGYRQAVRSCAGLFVIEVMIAQASWEACSVELRALFACLDEKGARQCSTAEELLERAREKGRELTAVKI